MLSLMLLVLGLAGLAGTFLIEPFLKNGLHRTLIFIPIFIAVIALALVSFGSSAATTTVLLGFWGLVATAAPVGWWIWLARTLPEAAEAGDGLMMAIIRVIGGFCDRIATTSKPWLINSHGEASHSTYP
jgi:predicted MFS family arabinose efflux permease